MSVHTVTVCVCVCVRGGCDSPQAVGMSQTSGKTVQLVFSH